MSPPTSSNSTVIGPHQRSHSVMAVPNELEHQRYKHHHSRHHQQPKEEQPLVWYQEIYKKYGYEPKHSTPSYFGPYLLLQTLGEGEFAKVKAGVHVQTNGEVAIKLMRKEHIKHSSLETKLEREISVLKSVQHPYIVKLFEVLTIKNYIGIVLQRAAGGELFDYILKHHCLQETEAKRLFAQLISGVHYMHQKHIVHRDLKLENLLLSKDRDIIITDFGFANRFQIAQQDLMATSCGSPCYAAPELVINDENNNHYVGTSADIWSCGVILFAMLCGYLPFDDDPSNPQGANINMLYKYIVSTPLEIPQHMTKDAANLLKIMLVPDPAKRCTMDDIRSHPWLADHRDLLNIDYIHQEEQDFVTEPESRDEMIVPCATNNNTTITTITQDPEATVPTTSILQAKFYSSTNSATNSNKVNNIPIIPNRSQSVVNHDPTQRRERTTSEVYTTTKSKHQSLNILPSVSEQTIVPTTSISTIRSKGQKLMDWFKRIPASSQSTKFTPAHKQFPMNTPRPTKTTVRPERPMSALPIRAMSIGKPFGSYAADFNDNRLRLHRGAVDQDALTSRPPNEILFSIKESLQNMGIDMKRMSDYKIKCIRPAMQRNNHSSVPFKLFFTSSSNNSNHAVNAQQQPAKKQHVMYGEQGIDNGEQVQFTVELSKIENLPGLYVVDIKRTRGNIWAFKFLYHTLLDLLDLSSTKKPTTTHPENSNRISYMTTSSSGSSMMIFDN